MSNRACLPLDSTSSETLSSQTDEPKPSHPTAVDDVVDGPLSFILPEGPKEQIAGYDHESSDITDAVEEVDEFAPEGSEDADQLAADEGSHAQTAPIAKKRRQDLAFQEWLEKNQEEVTMASKRDLDRHLEKASTPRPLEDGTRKKIISSPREYQIELFERARDENTIVVLDTGSGKTLIAALLLRHVLQVELQNRAIGHEPQTAFFLVEKVALCFQQHAVLTSNLEFPIGRFFGEVTGVVRTQEFWDEQFTQHMAVVCTAQILLDLLTCGFISMRQINLLVFDEAHHAKKNHPYARIIRDHYVRERNKRPRILGMTASPVDALTKDIRYAAAELESMLCSKIATVSDEALMQNLLRRHQVEVKEYYQRLEDPENSRTRLWGTISRLIRGNLQFRGHLEFASNASSTLGTWCADRYWQLLTTDMEMVKIEARTGRDVLDLNVCEGDEAVAAVGRAKKAIQDHCFGPIMRDSPELSSKVKTLYEVLEDAFCNRQAKRCIVFVQARSTAFLLADLFRQPGMHIPGMKDQIMALQQFRQGETNCLFATSVAEEGIDVPECDVIIRFDLYASAIQYIQSKGRARQSSSLYVSMMEEGNMEHMRKLRRATRDAHALRQFCSTLPEDRKVQDFIIGPELLADHEQANQKTYTIAETGARLTFISSLEVLARFASSFPHNVEDGSPQLEYIVNCVAKKFIARVILPEASPVKTVAGEVHKNKQMARCSAAFEACVQLIKKKYIDEHLQPAISKKLPEMRSARLAISSDKRSEYDMRIKPDFWSACLGQGLPATLYRTTVALDRPAALGRSSRPLILLTRQPLPDVPSAPLFFGGGQATVMRLSNSHTPIEPSPQEIEALAGFTIRFFAHVFSKEYDAKPHEIPYFIAPCDASSSHDEKGKIDWEVVRYVHENEHLHWEDAPSQFFKDKLAIDLWDGSRKFILNGINDELKPCDPTPKGVPQPRSSSYKKTEQTIKEYSNSLSLPSRKKRNWRDDQPVINAELLSTRRDFLDEFFVDDEVDGTCYIILEPLVVSPLPIDVVTMALVLPVVMYRIDSSLIALETCSFLGLGIRSDLALEAMTKDSFNTEEHGEHQVDFQPGMGKNYERLEFLGDTFLKMATTISVYTRFPGGDEFEYHVLRMLMLCNKNMFKHAVDRNLPAYIRTRAFDRRTWYPSNMTLKRGKAARTETKHCLSDKSIADVCEALIGAAYMTGSVKDMDMAVKAVTAMVKSENHTMTKFDDYFAAYEAPKWHSQQTTAAQLLTVDKIAEITGYRFECAPLLRSAFRHPSYVFESNIRDYQRLEFLGDALLDMAVVDYLFRRFPEADPKWLTEHKTAMVSNQFLGCVCVKLGLHKHILVATSTLLGSIKEYASQLEQAEDTARQKSQGSGVETALSEAQGVPRNFWVEIQQPPKALADVVEAVVGAMFVDSGYSFSVVLDFFTKFIQPFFEDMALYTSFASNHPVTAMAHKLQVDFCCNQWKLHVAIVPAPIETGIAVFAQSELLCALMVHGKVIAHATSAKSGSNAKMAVAKLALEKLESIQDADHFRTEMGCDCGSAAASN
ncbi:endoribonuclease dicer [Trichoderma arundinaceum]|uniref:Dicer-like protein 1 n=1 Tax=Trichoderma arundinaceum TaxID=490622 RepID=A0A395NM06_TRIAR|nr:endoribonuclease dicer [Trichoderma arundinaceum]